MRFSVIVPTFNRPDALRQCLAGLARSAYPQEEFEVIVVDDGGSAALGPVVGEFEDRMQVRLTRQSNAGPAAARNYGASLASGRFLAFTDDDCEPAENWLDALQRVLDAKPMALVGGRVVNGLPWSVCASASHRIVDHFVSHYNADPENARFFTSNNMALAAGLYREAGGFDGSFTRAAAEDREFCDAWLGRGWKLVCAPEAVVVHRHEMDLGGFWRQQYSYGRGAFLYAAARSRRGAGPVPFEGWRVHLALLAASPRMSALAALSQFAMLMGYARERFGPARGR